MIRIILAFFAIIAIINPAFSSDENKKKYKDNFECLAKNIYYEAGSESYETKLAVAFVTLNRVNSKRYPNNICGVVFQACQFVWHCEGPKREPNGTAWVESVQAATCAINNCVENNVKDALFFHDDSVKFAYKSKKVDIVLVTENMIFYKYKLDFVN